jgi:hypothetical protein
MSVLSKCGGERGFPSKIEVHVNNIVSKNSVPISQKTYCLHYKEQVANTVSGNNRFIP